MRTKYRSTCVRRTSDLEDWARSVIADPQAHCATKRDTQIVADLLSQLPDGAR